MKRNRASAVLIFQIALGFCMVLIASGCKPGRVPVYPSSGQVFVGGKPADYAFIVLHPLDPQQPDVPRTIGRAGPDGSFQLTTYETNDGAPAGRYKVTIEWRTKPVNDMALPGPDRLNGRYRDPEKSKIEVTIDKGPTTLEPIKLD